MKIVTLSMKNVLSVKQFDLMFGTNYFKKLFCKILLIFLFKILPRESSTNNSVHVEMDQVESYLNPLENAVESNE